MWVCLLQGLHSSPLNGLFGTQSLFPHRNSFINDGWEPRVFTETSLLQSYPAGDFWVGKTQLGTGLPFVPLLNHPYRPWGVSVSLKEDPSMIGAWSSMGRGKCYMRGPTPCSALLPAGTDCSPLLSLGEWAQWVRGIDASLPHVEVDFSPNPLDPWSLKTSLGLRSGNNFSRVIFSFCI